MLLLQCNNGLDLLRGGTPGADDTPVWQSRQERALFRWKGPSIACTQQVYHTHKGDAQGGQKGRKLHNRGCSPLYKRLAALLCCLLHPPPLACSCCSRCVMPQHAPAQRDLGQCICCRLPAALGLGRPQLLLQLCTQDTTATSVVCWISANKQTVVHR